MNKRIIFHIDVNNAFLSWSAVKLLKDGSNVDIRKISSVIGGDESKRCGIVLAKSPIAKKYGIKTAETLYTARKKCPNLKIFPPDYDYYYQQSRLFHNYLKQYTPNIEKYSVDEAFLDLTGTKYMYDDYMLLAHKIKDEIKENFGFTVNVGIGNNMLCAKMASDFEKPDKVHTLFIDEVKNKMWPLPIEDLFMVGKKTSQKMRMIGINTIGDLAHSDISILEKHFKNQARFFLDSANGINFDKVEKVESKNPSISVTETLSRDVVEKEELRNVLFRQVDEVTRQLRMRNKYCSVVAIVYKNSDFETYSKQTKLETPTNKVIDVYKNISNLLDISYRNDPIRLIGVRVSDFVDIRKKQLTIFDDLEECENNDDEFQKIVDGINNKFGNNSIILASMKKK